MKRSNKPIRKRTYKQAKIERDRFSIFTDDLTVCIECKKKKNHLHEIFRGSRRKLSIKWGLVIPLCWKCHNSLEVIRKWETIGQNRFTELYGYDKFMDVFKLNFIEKRRRQNEEKNKAKLEKHIYTTFCDMGNNSPYCNSRESAETNKRHLD